MSAEGSTLFHRAQEIVLRHGWHASSYQILNPGFRLWFSRDGEAVVGFLTVHRMRVVAAAPVCAAERLGSAVREFEDDARRTGHRVCYVGAESPLLAAVTPATHRAIVIGAQPVLGPRAWPETLRAHGSLRAQLNRARNKGVQVREWSISQAREDSRLRGCLDDWLAGRGLPPLHFLVEPDTLSRLQSRRVFVAERDAAPVGFLVLSPVPRRNGWLAEQIVRSRAAPNGTAELLVDSALRVAAEQGATFFTLGGAPLSRRAGHPAATDPPIWLRLGFGWLRAHGRRFFNTDGLESFKAKFRPLRWEPLFTVADDPRMRLSTIYAVASAFTGGSPIRAGTRGVARALRTEISWVMNGAGSHR
jgi:phosphatidylglycerol lysyltransferase